MLGGSVTKIRRIYKKWTYIARKQNIHLTKEQHISQNFTVQYKCNEQNTTYNKYNTRYETQKNKQNTEKQQNTQKQQNTKTRKKLLPGIEPGPSSL
jgi:hypothetical protein